MFYFDVISTYWYIFIPFSLVMILSVVFLTILNIRGYFKLRKLTQETWVRARLETNRMEEFIQCQLESVELQALV